MLKKITGLFQLTNVKAFQLFNVFRQGAVILIGVFLAKTTLALEEIGHYEMLLYLGFVLTFFWVAGLIQGFLSMYPQLDEKAQRAFIGGSYLFFLLLSCLLFLSLLFGKEYLLLVLTGQPDRPYFFPFVLYLAINLPSFLLENFLLLKNRPGAIVLYGALSAGLQLVAVIGPLVLGMDFIYSFYGLVAVAVIKHIWLLIFVWRNGSWQLPRQQIGHWLWLSSPLVLYALVGGFNQSFDNWLVGFYYQGESDIFAIFRYGARELPFALALAAAFSSALLPEVARDLEGSLSMIKSKSRKLFHLLFPVSILLMLTSQWWFPVVFSDAFTESVLIFNIFLLVLISRMIFSRTILVGLNDNRVVLYISILELVFNIALSYWLITIYGLPGVAIGTVLAYTLEKILISAYLYHRYRIPLQQYTDMAWFSGYSILLLAAFFLTTFSYQ